MTANGKTVLLVEDNEDNRIVYSTILRHFGYAVTEALNGEEGIAKARAEKPDLILMDISIPIIDGWEATQVLKHDPATRHIPVHVIRASDDDRSRSLRLGALAHLKKPNAQPEVYQRAADFLEGGDKPLAEAALEQARKAHPGEQRRWTEALARH